MTPRDRKNLEGRIGVTQTDSRVVRKPTVYFPTDGVNLELRLFRVDPSHIELVEISLNTNITPSLTEDENHSDLFHGDAEMVTSASEKGATLSQSEMDHLFD